VLAWSRWRFVRFAADEKSATTLGMLAECFAQLGGVPKVVLADRMGCLKGGGVANRVVPTGDYVRFATAYRFRPDFCEAADPASKGIVENLVGYGKDDLLRPLLLEHDDGPAGVLADLDGANERAAAWCQEVNTAVHSQVAAVPADRLAQERKLLTGLPSMQLRIGPPPVTRKVDRLSCVRVGSARYSVPMALIGATVEVICGQGRLLIVDTRSGEVVAEHAAVAPGEASVRDEHYGGARPSPRRAVRPNTVAEKQFCALGPVAEGFIAGAASAGHTRLGPELAELNTLAAAHGTEVFLAALGRATAFGRWKAADVRSILAAGSGTPQPRPAGTALVIDLPTAAGLSLSEYTPPHRCGGALMNANAPDLPADLTAGLRRLKLAAMRQLAPELLVTAKTQRWAPEEVLRTLVEAEISSRDASNARARLKATGFPVVKTIEEFDVTASSIPAPTFAYLTSLEWIGAKENVALIGPAGTDKSHTLIALGHAAVSAGYKVKYLTAADLVETLYRGLADNTVGKTIETLLRNDVVLIDEIGFAPLDDTGAQLLFRLVAAAYERRALGVASHWSFEDWGRFLPEHTTAVSLLDRLLRHATTVVTSGQSHRMREAKTRIGGGTHTKS